MQIDGFKVDGIANIEHANLRIEDLCALIAPNGYGKSNVLRAIEFGASKLKYLYKYAGDLELTFGEYMFDFMLDVEDDSEMMEKFFIQQ